MQNGAKILLKALLWSYFKIFEKILLYKNCLILPNHIFTSHLDMNELDFCRISCLESDLFLKYNLLSLCPFFMPTLYMQKSHEKTIQLRTLIFARHLFWRVHIFAAYIFAPEALGINFRCVSIFAWWLFSLFFQKIHWK